MLQIPPGVAIGGLLLALILAWYHGDVGRQRLAPLEILLLFTVVALTGGAAQQPQTEPAQARLARTRRDARIV